jgi:hypothetical protein
LQAGIHTLGAKRAVNVGGVAGDKHTPDAHLRYLAVMDAKIAAPQQGARLDAARRALNEHLPHKV